MSADTHSILAVVRPETLGRDGDHPVACRSRGAVADADRAVGVAPCLMPAGDRGRDR